MKFTMDTTLGTLMNEPKAKPIIEKYVPGIYTNAMVKMVKGIPLKKILAMPQATQFGITEDKVQVVLDEINQVIG